MKPSAFILSLTLLGLPIAVQAGEDLVAKREACQTEARQRITIRGKTKVALDEYQRLIERRHAHVNECMARTRLAVERLLLPPKRPSI
jgi:hypothetical protein